MGESMSGLSEETNLKKVDDRAICMHLITAVSQIFPLLLCSYVSPFIAVSSAVWNNTKCVKNLLCHKLKTSPCLSIFLIRNLFCY